MADNDTAFYTIVIVIALVILIGVLVFLAMQIEDSQEEKAFPPIQSGCPDYWDQNGTICDIPPYGTDHPNTGQIRDGGTLLLSSSNTPGLDLTSNPVSIDMASGAWSSTKTSICGKKDWANTYGLEWDGVSNYNNCNNK